LVKYGVSGKIEPYLSKSWTVSHDKKNWQFTIRDNLKCEDGTIITANVIKDNLLQNLKEYSHRKSSVIMFDHLLGWDDFIHNKSETILGLSAHDNIVELNFNENPDDLLELLRMPYFGLWLEKDHKIISSGPYTLKENSGNTVTLSLRKDWFTIADESIKEVEIGFVGFDVIEKELEPKSIVRMPTFVKAKEEQKDGYWITSPPTVIEAFVLSPNKHNFFDKLENRKIFKSRITKLYPSLVTSDFFYLSAKTQGLTESNLEYKKETSHEKLTFSIERMAYSAEELETLKKIITIALEGSGIGFEIIPRDSQDKEWFAKSLSNNHFDGRIAVVDIGGYPIYTAIKMMFCTKMGINFPDPTNEICRIVNEGIISAKEIDQTFVDKFNTIIHNDSIVIPIRHHSGKWLVSNDFDPKSLPTTTLYPQFELIRLR
jgi:MarR-like DNA-binding transcriptional regulator SgrR of sgrS sRNA